MIRVLIADDHHLVRQGIRALLERQPEIHVVGEAQNGQQAMELALRIDPDVLLLDINMPLLNGIEVTRRIRDSAVHTQVLILSMYSDESLVKKAFGNGARGYLLKKSISEDLIEALHCTSRRQVYISPDLLNSNLEEDFFASDVEENPQDVFDRLTNRERQVCELVVRGYTNHNIASQLGISIKTVEKHRANLMEKLGLKDVASLIRLSIRYGIVLLDMEDL